MKTRDHLPLSIESALQARKGELVVAAVQGALVSMAVLSRRVSKCRKDESMGCVFAVLTSSHGTDASAICFCPF
jgi:hypothetical protein